MAQRSTQVPAGTTQVIRRSHVNNLVDDVAELFANTALLAPATITRTITPYTTAITYVNGADTHVWTVYYNFRRLPSRIVYKLNNVTQSTQTVTYDVLGRLKGIKNA